MDHKPGAFTRTAPFDSPLWQPGDASISALMMVTSTAFAPPAESWSGNSGPPPRRDVSWVTAASSPHGRSGAAPYSRTKKSISPPGSGPSKASLSTASMPPAASSPGSTTAADTSTARIPTGRRPLADSRPRAISSSTATSLWSPAARPIRQDSTWQPVSSRTSPCRTSPGYQAAGSQWLTRKRRRTSGEGTSSSTARSIRKSTKTG